jgi:type II secretory pathway pseudopilin PulG
VFAVLPRRAFSLVEVVVALGVFAAGIISVLGLFGSLANSARANREAEVAAGIADALSSRLRTLPFETVVASLRTAAQPDGDAAASRDLFYASLAGDRIGLDDDPVWNGSDRDKFFEITLIRSAELSPPERDADAAWIAFNARVRWPAFRPPASGAAVRGTGRMQVLLLPGSVRR